jgi:hypothetical protein
VDTGFSDKITHNPKYARCARRMLGCGGDAFKSRFLEGERAHRRLSCRGKEGGAAHRRSWVV